MQENRSNMKTIEKYHKWVEWSEEDQVYIGKCPDLFTGIPTKIIALKAPKGIARRVEELIDKKKNDWITQEESVELERYLSLDLQINLAKARANGMLTA